MDVVQMIGKLFVSLMMILQSKVNYMNLSQTRPTLDEVLYICAGIVGTHNFQQLIMMISFSDQIGC